MKEVRDTNGECQAAHSGQRHACAVPPPVTLRLKACACYAGLYLLALGANRNSSPYLLVHRNQSLALFAVLFLFGMAALALIGALSYAIVFYREWMENFPVESSAISICRKILLVWMVFWGYAVVGALRGVQVPVPCLGALRERPWARAMGLFASQVLLAAMIAVFLLNMRAQMLLQQGSAETRVHLMYENLNRFPVWMFRAAFYPVIVAASERWGKGSAVLRPVSEAAIRDALSEGVFVFIGSHGTERGLLLEGGCFSPRDVPAPGTEFRLRYVYLAGCDSGAQRFAWEEALAPAEVKTYDRMTPVVEHLWWLWTHGPEVIRRLEE